MAEYKCNFSVMSESEAVRSYRLAKNKAHQIGVLADLLCCTKRDVKALLLAHGEDGVAKAHGNSWTDEDVKIATEMFENGADRADIAGALGKSVAAINHKLNMLGYSFAKREKKGVQSAGAANTKSPEAFGDGWECVSVKKSPKPEKQVRASARYRPWSVEEVAKTERMFREGASLKEIAATLERSEKSVRGKMFCMELSFRDRRRKVKAPDLMTATGPRRRATHRPRGALSRHRRRIRSPDVSLRPSASRIYIRRLQS